MTKNKTLAAALLAVCLLGGGARAADRPDAWITTKVKAALATHKSVSAARTHVDTDNGVVTLSGTARSEAEKELAERYAKDIEGVREVRNEISVGGASDESSGGESASGSKGDERGAGDKLLDRMDDGTLTARVKAALAGDRNTSALHTDVDTRNGVVILNGTAGSEEERDRAETLAKGVKGVKAVDNRIEVK